MSAHAHPSAGPQVTVNTFASLKAASRPIVMLTAYDEPSARLAEQAGVDAVLVGDSLGMTVLGHGSTLSVTMDDMVRHCRAVTSAARRVLVVADMPFMSYQADVADGVRNAGRLVAEGGAHAVKVEGAAPVTLELIERLVAAGVPVMGHLGLTPQSVHTMGGYRSQARDAVAGARLMSDAVALERAGVFSVVLECIPAELATRVSRLLHIPTIGIGAGAGCDGEVQVFHDLLGLSTRLPRHAKRYADLSSIAAEAIGRYADDVRDRRFPGDDQTVHADLDALAEAELLFSAMADGETP